MLTGQAAFRLFTYNMANQFLLARSRIFPLLRHDFVSRLNDALLNELRAVGMHHAKFQKRRLLDLLARIILLRLGQSGKLNQNPILARLLDDGFGDAQLVHALTEHFDGVFERAVLLFRARQLVRVHRDEKRRAAPQIQP